MTYRLAPFLLGLGACVGPLPATDGGRGGGGFGRIDGGPAGDARSIPGMGPGIASRGLTPEEIARVSTLSPLPELPKDSTNKYADDSSAAVLGQRLFFDRSYSGPVPEGGILAPGQLACASCHVGAGLADPRPEIAMQPMGSPYSKKRNSLGLVNASYYKWVNWGGRFSAQWELSLAVAENPNILNSDRLKVAHLLDDKYRDDYEAIFGRLDPALASDPIRFPPSGKPKPVGTVDGPWELMTEADRIAVNHAFVNYGKSIAAYLRTLVSGGSRFDAFAAGQASALDDQEVAGLKLFVGKARCIACHKGPSFTDDDFHNLGLPENFPPTRDGGRFDDIPPLLASPFNSAGYYSDDRTTGRLAGLSVPPSQTTMGQFRTPTLRNVVNTAPYLHAGQFRSLAEVVDFHDRGGGAPSMGPKDHTLTPLGLSPLEKESLVAFLGALTSAPLPAARLVDTSR